MKYTKFFSLLLSGLLLGALLTVSSCKDDEAKPAPTVTLSASTFSGKIGDTASVTATIVAPEGLKELRITKYLGTTVDATYGTNGTKTVSHESHTEDYILAEEGLTTPVRFNFTAEDNKGQTGTADLVITTEPSVKYLLTKFNWQWKSKVGKVLASDPEAELIVDCEKDNLFIFNADGTYSIDFGALTGSGGGTCDFDALVVTHNWFLSADESTLTLTASNIFDPTEKEEVYNITEATSTSIKSTSTVDLTGLGGIVWDWKFEWTAKPK